jgi:hypothetical protein
MDSDGNFWYDRLAMFTAHVRAVRNRLQELGEDSDDPTYKQISRELSSGIGQWGATERAATGARPGGRPKKRPR